MRRSSFCLALLAALLLGAVPAYAEPITLHLAGTVSYLGGVPPVFVASPVAVGDSFSVTLTYDPSAALTGPGALVDTYLNAVLGIDVTFHTASGPISYSADHTLSATTVNFATVRSDDVFFQVTDSDLDGTAPPVTGPSVAGTWGGRSSTYVPNFLALEFMGNFGPFLAADALPSALLEDTSLIRMSVGMSGLYSSSGGPVFHGADYVGFATPAATPVPEPASTLLLFGMGLVGLRACRKRWQ